MNPSVYLAGPISGLAYAGATGWREAAKVRLAADGIDGFSPMRAKHYLSQIMSLDKDCTAYGVLNVMSSNRGIITRDRHDATKCDVLLANLSGADRVSIGTCLEIAWADAHRVPIVLVMEDGDANPHVHGMILEAAGFRVASIDQALDICVAILKP